MAGKLTVFKDAKGHYRWITISSSAYQDRDGEIVSTKALAQDCDRADLDGDYGPLRWWHVPNLDIGDCDFNMMNGRLLIESGTFREERVGEILKEASGDYDVSLGFKHPVTEPDANKVFHTIRRFERSILPAGRASNLLTLFFVKGDDNMATLKEKEKALRDLLGDNALADSIIEKANARDKEAEDQGLAFKAARDDSKESHKDQEDVAEQVENAAPEGSEAVQEESTEEEDFDLDALLAELDEDYAEAADEVAKETTKAKKPARFSKKPAEDEEEDYSSDEDEMGEEDEEDWDEDEEEDEEKEAGEIPTFLGDIETDTFATLMADALSTALEPYFVQLKEIGERIKEIKEASESTKESHVMAQQETAKTVKEQGDELEKLRKAAITQATALAKTQKRLKELEEGAPPAAKGYIASQDESTVVKEGDPILKSVPQSDPLADFTQFVIGQSGQPGQAV